jgi:hypothetical protein
MPGNIKTYQTKRGLKLGPDVFIGWGTVILLIVVVLFYALAIWWLNHNPSLKNIWQSFSPDKKPSDYFCEKIDMSNPVRQPVSTFSSIMYLMVALVVFKKKGNERKGSNDFNLITANPVYSYFLGFILLYVFAASTFYHASHIQLALRLDYSAVFSFSLFPVMYFLQRLWLIHNRKHPRISKKGLTVTFYLVYIVACLLLSFFTPEGKEGLVTLILILAFITLAVLTEKAEPYRTDPVYLALSITSVLMALIWFQFDKYKVLCNPNSYFQPHSLWNLFIGLSAFYFYLYIRSEHESVAFIYHSKKRTNS